MTVTHAHFDGKVFIPDQPIDLPPGNVTLQVIETDMDAHPISQMPILRVPADAKPVTSEDVRRAMEED